MLRSALLNFATSATTLSLLDRPLRKTREEHYVPNIVTYEVLHATTPSGRTEDVSGTFVFFKNQVQGTMYVEGAMGGSSGR